MSTPFAQSHTITDLCLLVGDLERAAEFYTTRLGFLPRRAAPGFRDFTGAGLILALWQTDDIAAATGLPVRGTESQDGVHKIMAAVQLPDAASVDRAYQQLCEAGVDFAKPPLDYPWNARCCYFCDPDGNLWELYAWLDGGPAGDFDRKPGVMP